jgi:hypothetical protein
MKIRLIKEFKIENFDEHDRNHKKVVSCDKKNSIENLN